MVNNVVAPSRDTRRACLAALLLTIVAGASVSQVNLFTSASFYQYMDSYFSQLLLTTLQHCDYLSLHTTVDTTICHSKCNGMDSIKVLTWIGKS